MLELPTHQRMTANHRRQDGFTFLWLLFFIAGLGVGLAAIGTLWHTVAQREKEAELLFVGDQYRRAIDNFWNAAPDKAQQRLPESFEELLQDPRFPNAVRHLRRLYRDPMTGKGEWGLVKGQDGGIAGIYSLSEVEPMKKGHFPERYAVFSAKQSYREWQFQVSQAAAPTPTPTPSSDDLKNSDADIGDNGGGTIEDQGTALERRRRVIACEHERVRQTLICDSELERRGRDASLVCMLEVDAKYRDCTAKL